MSGGVARAATMTTAHTHEAPRIVLTGGGTGGHVYPALAIAGALRRRRPEAELLFVGGDRLEARVVPRAGMSFRGITVHGIAGRGLSGASRRLRAAVELSLGLPLLQSIARLRDFRPHVVIGTGGYVSGPVILAARLMGIPSLAVEGNRSPGWTSRAVVRLVDVMAVAHPEMAASMQRRWLRPTWSSLGQAQAPWRRSPPAVSPRCSYRGRGRAPTSRCAMPSRWPSAARQWSSTIMS